MIRKRTQYNNNRSSTNNSGGTNNNNNANRNRGRKPNHNHNNRNKTPQDPNQVSPRQRSGAVNQRDKYQNQAQDAMRSGDRVKAEYFFQHADHYNRIIDQADEQAEARKLDYETKKAERQEASAAREATKNEADANKPKVELSEADTAEKPTSKPETPVIKDDKTDEGKNLEAVLPTAKDTEVA